MEGIAKSKSVSNTFIGRIIHVLQSDIGDFKTEYDVRKSSCHSGLCSFTITVRISEFLLWLGVASINVSFAIPVDIKFIDVVR